MPWYPKWLGRRQKLVPFVYVAEESPDVEVEVEGNLKVRTVLPRVAPQFSGHVPVPSGMAPIPSRSPPICGTRITSLFSTILVIAS